jgi:hypothetical protein
MRLLIATLMVAMSIFIPSTTATVTELSQADGRIIALAGSPTGHTAIVEAIASGSGRVGIGER